ncbi:AAA family ATPase [Fulvivirgaceae bacterium LMO-SS25]
MKIKKLWVSEYKNIKDLTLEFESNLISLLVGRNGLGKSNLIEILALIFRDLGLLQTRQDFLNWPYDSGHFEYKIQYECKNSEMNIECFNQDGKDSFYIQRRQKGAIDQVFHAVKFSEFKRKRKEEYLPDYIIGYYSGENKRIREIIRPYEELAWDELKKNNVSEQGFRNMFFAENHHSQLVLLTILLYRFDPPSKLFKERLDHLIKEFTSFATLEEFRIHLKQPNWYKRGSEKSRNIRSIEYIVENLLPKRTKEEEIDYPFWDAKGKAHDIISFFYLNSPDIPTSYYDEDDGLEHLVIDLDKDKVATKVNKEFGHPANFLDALDSLFVIESIYEINLSVRSELRDTKFNFNSLSEGEQQMITVLGLILITGRQDCLFLLDEPDTHLNPAWQRRYVELLHQFNLNDDNSHIIVATHSPLIVQEAKECDIFLFKEGLDNKVEVDSNELKLPNWRIDHVLLSKYFNLESVRPIELEPWVKKRKEIIAKGNLTETDKKELLELENKIGYHPTGETIQELESMLFINQMANQLRNDKN